ncbi:MAG: lysyl oxidase family protein [Thermoplasmatota archaeon]
MRWAFAALLIALPALAGCLEEVAEEFGGANEDFLPGSAMKLDPASASTSVVLLGGSVALVHPGVMLSWEADCPCDGKRFVAQSTYGAASAGWMDVRVRWDGTKTSGLEPRLLAPDDHGYFGGERGFDDSLLRVWDPADGIHDLSVSGTGHATITVRMGSLDVPSEGALLPNLVEMVLEGPHVGNCDQVETAEQGAVKCMRFGNGVANPGHGPVQIRLTVEQAAQALAPLDGRFSQEIRQADGSVEEHPVGAATFHPTHGHWHYDGLAVFDLYEVDTDTGLRGELAASHGKSGFCFLDWDEMVENITEPAEQERAETDCLIPGVAGSWTNGISRGWYDFYYYGLTDQYVDIDGLADGVYELVASADPLGTLDELDETDNQSSLLLSISGDDVEVLEERAHYRVQEDDDA